MQAARRLVTDDCVLHAGDEDGSRRQLRGFEEFLAWYGRKRARMGDSSAFEVEELLSGKRYGAALLRLSAGAEEWRQVAVYRIRSGRIAEIWLDEGPGSW